MRLVQRSLLFGRPSATRLCAKRPALQRLQLRKRRPERSVLMATCSSAGPERTDLDVAIIGGGPGGLAVAKAIEVAFKGSMRTRVYESQKVYRLQGSVITVGINCQHALEAISPDLLSSFVSHGLRIEKSIHFDTSGKLVSMQREEQTLLDKLSTKYNKGTFALGWHECRHLLYEDLPTGTVEFDKQMSHYEEDEEGLTLHFDRGQPTVHARVLIGADGYFSKTRSQCVNDGPPTFSGAVLWRARVGWQEGMPDTNCTVRYLPPGCALWTPSRLACRATLHPMGTIDSTKHKGWTWMLAAPMAKVQEAAVEFDPDKRTIKAVQGDASAGSALENVLKVFAGYPPALMDIVRSTDPTTVTQHGLYTRNLSVLHQLEAPSLVSTTFRLKQSSPDLLSEQQMQPQTSPGQPQTPHGQLQTPLGQPQTPLGQPQTPLGQPQTTPGQPQTSPGQPQTSPGQPQTPLGQPQTPAGQQRRQHSSGALNTPQPTERSSSNEQPSTLPKPLAGADQAPLITQSSDQTTISNNVATINTAVSAKQY